MSGSFDEMLAELEKDRPSLTPRPTTEAPPGPWRHEPYPASPDKFWIILDRDGTEIGYAKDERDSAASIAATAALMCAAPDMLKLLKEIVVNIRPGHPSYTRMKELIDKAEDRTP